MSSANFELYTTWTEAEAVRILDTFEQTRAFFLRTNSFAVMPDLPVVLVAFENVKDYNTYRPRNFVPAYFAGDEQRDYIVMSDVGAERVRVAVHEYVHVLVRHSGLSLPLWLNEGMAEVYAGMKTREGKVFVGNIPDDRAYTLASGKWMRLAAVVNAGTDSPEYNEGHRSGMFYAQSCLLAHMLMLGEGYAQKFATLINRFSASGSSQAVLAEVYGKSLPELETEMLSYFRQSTIGGAAYAFALEKVETGSARPATELEVDLMRAKLTGFAGRLGESDRLLERIHAGHPEQPDVEEAQAYLAWQTGDLERALRTFHDACSRGERPWKTYRDYARLLQASGRSADALAVLQKIRQADPRYAVDLYLQMARAAAAVQQGPEALAYLDQARKYSRSEQDKKRVDAVSAELQQQHGLGPVEANAGARTDEDEKRPILRRRAPLKPSQRIK